MMKSLLILLLVTFLCIKTEAISRTLDLQILPPKPDKFDEYCKEQGDFFEFMKMKYKERSFEDYFEECDKPRDFFEEIKAIEGSPKKPKSYGKIVSIYDNFESSSKRCWGQSRNSFFDMFWMAFNTHSEIILSPDDVWIAISLAFSQHIQNNAEKLREKFVSHNGKEKLMVKFSGDYEYLEKVHWGKLLDLFGSINCFQFWKSLS